MVTLYSLSVSLLLLTSTTAIKVLGDSYKFILPADEQPVVASYNNVNLIADYTFKFIPDTRITSNGSVRVIFPDQYQSGLGITGTPDCSPHTCTVTSRTVEFTMSDKIFDGDINTVTIKDVRNPSATGGTGNFQIFTLQSGYIRDQNQVFGTLGIASAVSELTSTGVDVAIGQSYRAGQSTYYDFVFRIGVDHGLGDWMKIKMPDDDFTIARYPSCSQQETERISLSGTLLCTYEDQVLDITGFSQVIPANTPITIRLQVINPPKSGLTGSFSVETGMRDTNTMYQIKTGIAGITILPGIMPSCTVAPSDETQLQAKKKMMLYDLSFTTFNPIPQGGSIQVILNNNFNIDEALISGQVNKFSNYVVSGLKDVSYTSEIQLTYDSVRRIFTLTNFQALTAQSTVVMRLELSNPDQVGRTLPIVVRSFWTDGSTIDENTSSAVTTILDISGPETFINFGSNIADGSLITSNLEITLWPNVEVPKEGYIVIKFPDELVVGDAVRYQYEAKADLTVVNPSTTGDFYDQDNNQSVKVQLNGAANNNFYPLLDSKLILIAGTTAGTWNGTNCATNQCGIKAPEKEGYFIFDLTTYNGSDQVLESCTFQFTYAPNTLTTWSMDPYTTTINTIDIFEFTVIPSANIPTGVIPSTTTDTHSYIQLEFPTSDGADIYDIGFGISTQQGDYVSCAVVSGMTLPEGENELKCQITTKPTVAAAASPLIVRVTNYAAITSGTTAVFELRGLFSPKKIGAFDIPVRIYEQSNRIVKTINQNPVTTTYIEDTSVNTGTVTSMDLSATTVNSDSVLTLVFSTAAGASATNRLIIYFRSIDSSGTSGNPHEDGYCGSAFDNDASRTCSVVDSSERFVSCKCDSKAKILWMDLNDGASVNIPTNTAVTYKFVDLKIPSSVPIIKDTIQFILIESQDVQENLLITNGFDITPGTIEAETPRFNGFKRGSPDVTYTFSFQASNPVPDQGQMFVVFPNQFQILYAEPEASCIAQQLYAYDSKGVLCTVNGNWIRVSNFKDHVPDQLVIVTVYGVKNPIVPLQEFRIYTFDNSNRLIDRVLDIDGLEFQDDYQQGSVIIFYASLFPSNAKVYSDLDISFQVTHTLSPGGFIYVQLPVQNFGSLNTDFVDCRVSGAVDVYRSCEITGRSIVITLDEKLEHTKIMHLHLSNVLNPDEGATQPLYIATYYDNVLVDSTDTVTGQEDKLFQVTSDPQPLLVTSYDFYPQNEGESATYIFVMKPSFDVSSNEVLSILFPEEFGLELGLNISCTVEGLEGQAYCSLSKARIIDVKDFRDFDACDSCYVTIRISGIINPNHNNGKSTGSFKLGFRTESHFTQYNENVGKVSFLPAPKLATLNSFTASNFYSRRDNQFSITFTSSQSIPETAYQGAVWITFPSQFNLAGTYPYCLSDFSWAGGVPNCNVDVNNVVIDGQTQSYNGQLNISLDYVPNPKDEVETDTIIVKTYSGINKRIINRSYPNLGVFRQTFQYPGPLIVVNNDEDVVLVAGTVSKPIPISLDYPAGLNITLVPSVASGIELIPYTIDLFVGDILYNLYISASSNIAAEDYYINWTTNNDLDDPYYTPISTTKVLVYNNIDETVSLGEIPAIPLGGTSLPIQVNLSAGPNVRLDVNIEIQYDGLGITPYPSTVVFDKGQTTKTFVLLVDTDADIIANDQPKLLLSLSSTNKYSYTISENMIPFEIIQAIDNQPAVTNVVASNINKTSATLTITTTDPMTLYYGRVLRGTRYLQFADVKSRKAPQYTSTNTVYFTSYTYSTTTTIQVTGLVAGTKYTYYFWGENMLGVAQASPFVFRFATIPSFPAAYTTLNFQQNFINGDDSEDVRSALQTILSLPEERLIQRNLASTAGASRRLQASGQDSQLSYYVIDDPNTDNYPQPQLILNQIVKKRDILDRMLPRWDSNQQIVINEEYLAACSFNKSPSISAESAYNEIRITSSLIEDGYIYAVLTLTANDPRNTTSYQIYHGLNGYNEPLLHGSIYSPSKQTTTISFTNLQEETDYNVYITCANDYPGQPILKNDDGVVTANWLTGIRPQPKDLNLDNGEWLSLTILLLLALF